MMARLERMLQDGWDVRISYHADRSSVPTEVPDPVPMVYTVGASKHPQLCVTRNDDLQAAIHCVADKIEADGDD